MSDAATYKVLIVEDDRSMRASLIELLEADKWLVHAVSRAATAIEHLAEFQPDVILSDVRMPGMSGLELLDQLSGDLSPPLVLISAHGDIPTAVQAIQNGAYSFLEKPHEPRRLLNVLKNAANSTRIRQKNERLKNRLASLSGLDRRLLGQNAAMVSIRQNVVDLADTGTSVLILGETGTGKDVVARALHDLGSNSDAPFQAINCATLKAETFDAEMFGDQSGPQGRIAAASGGTLFLDEVASCPPQVQAMLLRFLEDKLIHPIGGNATKVQTRILSATNADLTQAVDAGAFRRDLFYRLNTITVELPPLRNRADDLPLLLAHFLNEFGKIYDVLPPEPNADDLAALMRHDWPGNVRELRSVAERHVLKSRRGASPLQSAIDASDDIEDVPPTLREAVAVFERELITKAIAASQGRMDEAADSLGIGRRTLNEKIVKLGLDKDALL